MLRIVSCNSLLETIEFLLKNCNSTRISNRKESNPAP